MKLLDIKHFITGKIVALLGGQKVMALQIDNTNACNLSCAHCYHAHHQNKGAISFDDWCNVISQYKAMIEKLHLSPSIILCGGEPTISPMLLPILQKVDEYWPGVHISILTNGTRLTDSLLGKLKKYNVEFQISLDGPDAARHDEVRGAGNFAKATDAVRRAKAQGFDVFLLAILSKKTSLWIEEFFSMAKDLGVNQMNFTRFITQGAGAELESSGADRALRPQELKGALTNIWFISQNAAVRTNTDQALYNLIDPRLGASEKYGFQGLVIDYKGNLKVSSRADFIVGNVLAQGLENLFLNSSVLRDLRRAKIEKCGDCSHFRRCGGSRNASFASSGSFLKADPGCWI